MKANVAAVEIDEEWQDVNLEGWDKDRPCKPYSAKLDFMK
jgi:hypothetical protein